MNLSREEALEIMRKSARDIERSRNALAAMGAPVTARPSKVRLAGHEFTMDEILSD